MYSKAMKASRSNLKDRSELLTKHKKLKRNSGTFGRKSRTKFIKLTDKPSASLISLRKLLKLITANRKENRKEKPRKVAILLNTTHRLTKEKSKTTMLLEIMALDQEEWTSTPSTIEGLTEHATLAKGHKEADCRSKMTYGFCGKKGHDETHCYTKKNAKKSKTPKDKA
ncbi:LOW QUALITY PROTEIN: hypothetical protein MKX08_000179 [Trichoderma sp. CBMAI-0020]|nr:LOW QUALITY PROTEIN: hypothetical protein MKX08_000179 [Trichoderma sp. CBMAI-0020]